MMRANTTTAWDRIGFAESGDCVGIARHVARLIYKRGDSRTGKRDCQDLYSSGGATIPKTTVSREIESQKYVIPRSVNDISSLQKI